MSEAATRGRNKTWVTNTLCLGVVLCIYGNMDPDASSFFGVSFTSFSFRRFWYITNLTLGFSTLALSLRVCLDLWSAWGGGGSHPEKEKLEEMHSCLVSVMMVAETIISVIFWPLFFHNPELFFAAARVTGPRAIGIFPNICMHGLPVLFLGVDYFTDPNIRGRRYNKSLAAYWGVCAAVLVLYYQQFRRWRYALISKVPGWCRAPALLVILLVMYPIHWSYVWVYGKRRGLLEPGEGGWTGKASFFLGLAGGFLYKGALSFRDFLSAPRNKKRAKEKPVGG
ncbi:hypothetical protein NEDG_01387 [Nematocida displodere]|uniref:Uncharacterized protein n=1 Tax=Nematocida displodere TaxID=1805483 RepID=A0A177EBI4_9MICR|nr:hypothetical protein NEDG_01387 [Nematocida displodere]